MAKKILKKIARSVAKKIASKKPAKSLKAASTTKTAAKKAKALHSKPAEKAKKVYDLKAKKAAPVAAPEKNQKASAKAALKARTLVLKKDAVKTGAPHVAVAETAAAKGASAKTNAKKHVLSPAKVSVKVMNRCREVACDSAIVGAGYCRLHYIKNWKQLKAKEQILAEGTLDRFIKELIAKFPEKYIEAIRFDLHSELEFAKVALDLNLTEAPSEDFSGDEESVASDDGIIESIKKESIEEISEEF